MKWCERLLRFRWLVFPAAVIGVLMLWSLPTPLIAKKVIALLMLPAGLVWLALMVLTGWPGLERRVRIVAATALMLFTLCGNSWLGGWLLKPLESPYLTKQGPAEPFDAICVLGGGSSATPTGDAQLGPAGDRLIVPVRLFLAGKTKHLVASGLNVTDVGGARSLANDTALLWRDLGIPADAITMLDGPRTTSEEIHAYKELMTKNGWQQVGVCSSAWHLPRVEALCRKEGISMTPIPADFLSGPLPWSPMYAVPQARGFQHVQKALWEYLGKFTGA